MFGHNNCRCNVHQPRCEEHRDNHLGTTGAPFCMYHTSFNSTTRKNHYTKHELSYYKYFQKSYHSRRCPMQLHDRNIPVPSLLCLMDPHKEFKHPFLVYYGLS